MKRKFSILFLLLISLILISYKLILKENNTSKINSDNIPNINSNNTEDEEKYLTKYTGEESSKEIINLTPFMAIIENSKDSRPQSGLSQADIIYETSAEGGIPRFIAIFQKNPPDIIGPIRSVRPYFIDIAQENNLPFAHCGGSSDALNEISSNNSLMSINEISNGKYFWRDKNRKAPHNLYTSKNLIYQYISDKNLLISESDFYSFDEDYYKQDSQPRAHSIKITINKYYNTSYEFKDGGYIKSMDGVISIDANNNEPLSFSNIIIQKTNIKLSDDNLHLDINLEGNGDALILSNGKLISGTWKHISNNENPFIYDDKGNEIKLSPGKTIWHILDYNTPIEIK